ncbi:GNAT family N-acetyltransferase [Rhodopila sp.]|uniref:GNAT family N-acetyltransferase n=1 Tax=Rhodopila sp. TaxID=2480087 RepID=UPI003D0EADFB
MSFTTEVVTNAGRFAAIQPAWQQLWESSGSHIFQSHAWIAGWLGGVRGRREIKLQIALAWDGDRLGGAMPCAVHRRSGLRVLTWAAQLFSDYCDCLLDPAHATAAMPVLWSALHRFGGFDLVSLQQIRPDAKCREFLDRIARDGRQLQPGDREERCMRIENQWPNGEAFFRSLNKKGRNNHTRGKRILTELGGEVEFRCIEQLDNSDALIDEIMRLKELWLRANDPTSPLLDADGPVLRSVLDHACQSGLAKLFVLECGGRIAAASVNFVYSGRMEAYFTAYDPMFDRASPGTILIVEYARWSFDRGLCHVDFLRGAEAFKFRMANAETLLSSFTGARTLMGKVAVSGHRWLARRRQRQDTVSDTPPEELETAG